MSSRIPPRELGARPKKKITHINGLTKDQITKEELEEHVARLRAEVQREKLESELYRLECNKIKSFRDISLKQLQELQAEERKLLEEAEEEERLHLKTMEDYEQNIRLLLREHQKTISELKADALRSNEVLQKEQKKLENELHEEMRAIKADTQEPKREDLVKEIQRAHDEKMAQVRDHWEKKLAEIEAKYRKKEESLSVTLGGVKQTLIRGKAKQLSCSGDAASVSKAKLLAETKALTEIMKQDIESCKSLKEEHDNLQKSVQKKRKDLRSALDENKRLAERIKKAEKEYDASQEKIKFYQAKMVVDTSKKKELKKMKREFKALQDKFSKLTLEKEELEETFVPTVQRAQQKAANKKMTLERKLKGLTDRVERTRAEIDSLLSTPDIDRAALDKLTKTAEELLESRNNSIKKLRTYKAQLSEAHKDLLFAYQAKRRSLGLPVEKL